MINTEEYSKNLSSACFECHKFIDAEAILITKNTGDIGILESEVISLHIAMAIFLTQFKYVFGFADSVERKTEQKHVTRLLKSSAKDVIKNLDSLVEKLPNTNENIAYSSEIIPHAG